MVFLLEDISDGQNDSWFISETDVVESYLRFGPMIGNAIGMPGEYRTHAEALICALTGIAHMAVTVSEYPWALPEHYIDMIVKGLLLEAREAA